MQKTIIFVAGRSGGHIIPCISLAQEVKQQSAQTRTIFLTTNTPLDNQIIAQHSWIDNHYAYNLGNFPGKKFWKYPSFITQFLICFFKSLWLFYTTKPTKITSTGSYIAIPICYAAKLLRVPIELYELNVIPGKAIKLLAPLANTVHICFKQTQQYLPKIACGLASYPLKSILKNNTLSQLDALQKLGLSANKKTILILGGSQGSQFLNNLIKDYVQSSPDIQVIHQTGNDHSLDWQALYKKYTIAALVFDFAANIEQYYAAADIILCRAGAGTLFELVHLNKKVLTVPLETASTNHQKYNALALAEQYPNLITVLEQREIVTNLSVFTQKLNALS